MNYKKCDMEVALSALCGGGRGGDKPGGNGVGCGTHARAGCGCEE